VSFYDPYNLNTNAYDVEHLTQGYWAIRFFDKFGEDWVTKPIIQGATCAQVVAALEDLPNNVVPSGYTQCTLTSQSAEVDQEIWHNFDNLHPSISTNLHNHPYHIYYNMSIWDSWTQLAAEEGDRETAITDFSTSNSLSGYIYRLHFYGNPGALKQPQIELYLDGKRPSLKSFYGKLMTKVWTDGQQGEDNDYFADHCDGVTVTFPKWINSAGRNILGGLSTAELALFKACLGNSDFDTANNQDVYNWDVGTQFYPHIVKLVRTVTTYTDGGYYAVIYFDTTTSTFLLLNPFVPPDHLVTDQYEVYTTTGTLALTSNYSQVAFGFASTSLYVVNSTMDTYNPNPALPSLVTDLTYDGDLSCEVGLNNAGKMKFIQHCLNKTDIITMLNWGTPSLNPPNLNLYTVQNLKTNDFAYNQTLNVRGYKKSYTVAGGLLRQPDMHYMTHVITTDLSTNWAGIQSPNPSLSLIASGAQTPFRIYKFFPATKSTYNYVAECSNRGICDDSTGICKCFPGYTNDDCSVQNSIAL